MRYTRTVVIMFLMLLSLWNLSPFLGVSFQIGNGYLGGIAVIIFFLQLPIYAGLLALSIFSVSLDHGWQKWIAIVGIIIGGIGVAVDVVFICMGLWQIYQQSFSS